MIASGLELKLTDVASVFVEVYNGLLTIAHEFTTILRVSDVKDTKKRKYYGLKYTQCLKSKCTGPLFGPCQKPKWRKVMHVLDLIGGITGLRTTCA